MPPSAERTVSSRTVGKPVDNSRISRKKDRAKREVFLLLILSVAFFSGSDLKRDFEAWRVRGLTGRFCLRVYSPKLFGDAVFNVDDIP